mgnify:CR=1 FL=1
MFIINSNKAENIKVESAEKPKNGKPNKYADNNPFKFNVYIPEVIQTPKLVTMKNIIAPSRAPEILKKIFFRKKFENNPIIKTEPQVNNMVLWNPIKRSVIKKLDIRASIYFLPKNAGT